MIIKPHYKIGETVYIKEPFSDSYDMDRIRYKYDQDTDNYCIWENPRTMAARQARHFIEITGVRCERVQDISDEDILSEGIYKNDIALSQELKDKYPESALLRQNLINRRAFADLFDSINGKGKFQENPFCWVYSFRLVNKSFDEILELNKDVLIKLKNK